MTREEATTMLKDLWRYEHTEYTDKEVRTALDMAIQALQFDIHQWADEHFIELVDKDVWVDAKIVLQAQADGDLISRTELLKALETWDRFGVDDTNSLFRLDNLSLPHYVAYIHYDDVIKCIKGMPFVKPQERTGYISIDDVMSVFDDFMCGEVDEDGTDTFLEMLKEKAIPSAEPCD